MANNHFVPRLTLRKFADKKICVFNIQTGEYKENIKIDDAFSYNNFYSDEVEDKLRRKIESQFGNLLHDKILNASTTIKLKRDELRLIKKFLLISVIRSLGSEDFMQQEKNYYKTLNEYSKTFAKLNGYEEREIEPPFIEKTIDGETSFDYWMRTLNVILDTDGSPEEILKHSDKTYPAHRWALVNNNGYVAFWDSEYEHDEFVITDIGMTSENEKGWNGITRHNVKKTNFLINLIKQATDYNEKLALANAINMHANFSENFMMFPISAKRMIVEIDPFYKFRIANKDVYNMPKLEDLTQMTNENLFYPNKTQYILPQKPFCPVYHPDDLYIYDIKKLTSKETRYCNELFLDRINTTVGFSSLNKVVGSLFAYKKANSYPFIPRVDYTELYKIINDRYGSSIDTDTISSFRESKEESQ